MPRFHDWFSHSSASFPYSHERRAAILQSRKSLDGELLFDKLLALLQIQGSIVYPPSSPVQLEQLFRLIAENEDVEPLKKFCLVAVVTRYTIFSETAATGRASSLQIDFAFQSHSC
jgi:hypothetical protein